MKRNEVGVVVSRYYEDLKWIEQLTSNIDVYVYNRSGDSPGMGVPDAVAWAKPKDESVELGGLDIEICKKNGINLEIIDIEDDPGFEASTYLHHMYTKYDDLNDYTVFIQAHPQIYVANIIDILNSPNRIKHTKYIKQGNIQLSPNVPHLIEDVIEFEPFCDNSSTLYPTQDYQWSLYSSDFSKVPWLEFCKNMSGSFVDADGKWHPINSWTFGAGNQFIVSKKLIMRNPKVFYKKAQDFANSYMDPNGDKRPWFQQLNQGPNIMEGIWQFIF